MDMHELTRELHVKNDSKIVLLVADGLGGLPLKPGELTELETANTPHLDELARIGVSGGLIPVKPGITPGSGPGHLGLFAVSSSVLPPGVIGSPPKPSATSITIFEPLEVCNSRVRAWMSMLSPIFSMYSSLSSVVRGEGRGEGTAAGTNVHLHAYSPKNPPVHKVA